MPVPLDRDGSRKRSENEARVILHSNVLLVKSRELAAVISVDDSGQVDTHLTGALECDKLDAHYDRSSFEHQP